MKQVIIRLRKHEADPLSVCSPEYITFCDEKSCRYLKHLLSDDRDYFKESELPIVKQLAEAHGWVMTLELEEKFKEDIERLKEREEFGGQMKFSELLEGKESFVPNDSLYLPNTHNDFKKELSNLMGILEQYRRERDEAIEFSNSRIQLTDNLYLQITGLLDDLEEYKKENAKLREIAERAVAGLEAKYKLHCGADIQLGIRAELEQIKGGGE